MKLAIFTLLVASASAFSMKPADMAKVRKPIESPCEPPILEETRSSTPRVLQVDVDEIKHTLVHHTRSCSD